MTDKPAATDMLIDTDGPPEYLDETLQRFGAALIGGGMPQGFLKIDGYYVARCFANPPFIKYMVTQQGYGTVIKVYDGLYTEEESDG